MLRYRVLLVDTEGSYERPVQTFCNNIETVDDWARKTLANKGPHAYVVVYRVNEIELGTIKKSDYDKGGPKSIATPGKSEIRLVGELGSPDYHYQKPVEIDDDDVPF
jgi:hypothetical protein